MAPYTVQLDADTAHDLTQHGGTLLLLGVPLGTIFGLDQQVIKENTSSGIRTRTCYASDDFSDLAVD